MNTEETDKKQNSIIQILPDYIANQIAAGEVVQRPESVIKELVENSLDAGADTIAVIVKGAGKLLIHIVDNGRGMSREDIELSVKRHATSKIKTAEDLEKIMSFGFRGEALASITAVAQLEIRSKLENDIHGYKLTAEPMKEIKIEPVNMNTGTQVFVRNLFYNVPARRKFLRSDLTEFRYISDTMIKLAVSNPDKRFTFYDNETMIFDVKPDSLANRIAEVLGNKVRGALIPVAFSDGILSVDGFVGQPHLAKQSAANQYFFLNGRSIQSKNLSHAVFSAFEHLLEKNAKPMFVLNLKIDPEKVDVNIHPQKNEVKFEEERSIYGTIRRAVFEALNKFNMTPGVSLDGKEVLAPFETIKIDEENGSVLVNKLTGEIIETNSQTERFKRGFSSSNKGFSSGSSNQSKGFYGINPSLSFNQSNDFKNLKPDEKESAVSAFDAIFESRNNSPIHKVDHLEQFDKPAAAYWQVHNKYIFTHTERGILIIDQHNAHERILYEKAIKAMNKEFSNSQTLLFDISVHLNSAQKALADELSADLKNLGFIYDNTENNTILLHAIPIDLTKGNETNAVTEILDDYLNNLELKHTQGRDRLAATFSCKSAIKTGHKLSGEEMKSLAEGLMRCEMPYVCPHGRPIILEITLRDLDIQFKRTPVDL